MSCTAFCGGITISLATDQHEDRQFQSACAHQRDQRGALALHAALAPVDHHAADGGVGADGELGLFRPARPQHLEPELCHRPCDLLQPRAFERSRKQRRHAEQEFEMLVIFMHVLPRSGFADHVITRLTRRIRDDG
jgi:hypothetical protein